MMRSKTVPRSNTAYKSISGSLATRLRIVFSCALVAGCVSGSGTARAALDPRIVHACTVTMESSEGTTDYDNCVSSIVGALDEVRRDKALSQAWASCSSRGAQDSPAFAQCVLDREERISTAEPGEPQ